MKRSTAFYEGLKVAVYKAGRIGGNLVIDGEVKEIRRFKNGQAEIVIRGRIKGEICEELGE